MSELMSPDGYELFRHWSLYERVVRFNHMRHREISLATRKAVGDLPQPLRVLDLGSGAGEFAFDILGEVAVREYLAIDLSADAIAQLLAKDPPGTLGSNARLAARCGDMLDEMRKLPAESYDLVLASYALHHFPRPQKPGVLAEIARVLTSNGSFLWIDLVREEAESAAKYLQRSCRRIREEWHSLSSEEKDTTCHHALTCDFPEQASEMEEMLAVAGFAPWQPLYRDELYGAWIMKKESVDSFILNR